MAKLNITPKSGCMWDLVSLGEVMLRLDPGDERISTTRHFRAWEGGGEYNVARGLRRCFGMDTAIVTALADNPVGLLVEDLMLQGGVSQKYVRWVPYDGVGRVEFYRERLWVATSPWMFGSWPHRRLAIEAR
jgi:2-dehydro-3-deoxygluconokinase